MAKKRLKVEGGGELKHALSVISEFPPSGFILPKGRLSPSQVNSYLRCPRAYEFRYIEGVIEPPALALTEGSSHHAALEYNNKHKIKKGEDHKTKRVVEFFCDDFSDRKSEIENWQGDKEKNVLERGRKMVKRYMENLAPGIKPIEAEKKIKTEIFGIPFLMFVDLTEKLHGKRAVADYKTGSKMKSQKEADNDLQLSLYGVAEDVPLVSFICLTKSIVPKAERVESVVDARRIFIAEQMVLGAARGITLGSFPMCDSTIVYTCSKDWCGYWHRCKGKRIRKTR